MTIGGNFLTSPIYIAVVTFTFAFSSVAGNFPCTGRRNKVKRPKEVVIFGMTLGEIHERTLYAPPESKGVASTASTLSLTRHHVHEEQDEEIAEETLPTPTGHGQPPQAPEPDESSQDFDCAESSDPEEDEKEKSEEAEFAIQPINFEDVALGIAPRAPGALL